MKKMKKLFAMFLAVVMIFSMLPTQQAQAASKVKLNKTKATIYVGGSTTLKVTGTKSKIKWSTSKKSVATVSNKGKVVGKKAGKATITAKVGKKSYTCKVTVKKPYLNKTKLTLTAGQKYQLKITGTTAKKWKSSKTSVATVDKKGKVTAKKAGTTTITCTGKDKKTYKCTVTVKGKAALNKTKLTLTVGDKYQLKITGTTAQKWKSSKTSVATVDKNGKVTAKKAGTTTITCTGKDKKTYQCTITVKAKAADKDTHTHSYTWKVTKNATCTAEGEKVYQCSCGHIQKTEKIAKTAHTYQQKKTAATCTEKGYTTYTCKACKHTYKGNYVDALGHKKVIDKAVAPTCTEPGKTEGSHCSVCGKVLEEQKTVAANDHSYTAEKAEKEYLAKEATCTEATKYYKSCSVCGAKGTETFESGEPLGHKKVTDKAVEPTCTEPGKTEGSHCSVCKKVLEKQTVIPAKNHRYNEKGKCINCGHDKEDSDVIVPDPWRH